jgi:hypothetical protein
VEEAGAEVASRSGNETYYRGKETYDRGRKWTADGDHWACSGGCSQHGREEIAGGVVGGGREGEAAG